MTSVAADRNRPDNRRDPVDADPGASSRFDGRAVGGVGAADPRWRKLGIAAVLGLLTGATLFATEAQGRHVTRRPVRDRERGWWVRPA